MAGLSFPPLRSARVHEACGPAATSFAAAMGAKAQGYVFWVFEARRAEALVPQCLNSFFDVANLVLAQAPNQKEALPLAEEALRDGACPLVVIELSASLSLTEGRRLQLAAKAGGSTGLCLIPGNMPNNTAETRWDCSALPDPDRGPEDSTLQRWALTKNKSGTLGVWNVRWDQSARRLIVVSASRE
ncbi:hypothetical protein MWU51_09345 [Aliiroseovarius sp. F47248L]|nr:hypothetical protein [Aliiroseovarius sp. F47248L]MCK0139297.1 hypothetical protein [Aliiroseovarius sp. F47248L]